jgi:CHAT domain-containing protein
MERRPIRDFIFAPLLIAALAVSAAACGREEQKRPPPAPPPTPAAVLNNAHQLMIQGDAAAAEKALAAERAKYGAGDKDELALALRVKHGETLLLSARRPEAIEVLDPAPPPALGTTAPAVRRLIVLSYALPKPALVDEARKLAESHQPALLPEIYNALSNHSTGQKSIDYARTALKLAEEHHDELAAAYALGNLSFRSCGMGQPVECVAYGEEALRRCRKGQFHRLAAKTAGNLGWGYITLGELETAKDLFVDAERAAAKIGDSIARIAWLNQIANLNHMNRNYGEAGKYYLLALPLARETNDRTLASILTNLARLAVDTGDLAVADARIAESLAVKKAEKADEVSLLQSYLVQGRILGAKKQYADAERLIESIARKAAASSFVKWESEGQLARIYQAHGDNRRAEARFREALRSAKAARDAIEDRELRLSFARLFSDVLADYLGFLVANGRAEEALLVVDRNRAQTLAEDLGIRERERAIVPRDVARRLNATILSYALGPECSYLWTITTDGVRVTTLPKETVINTAVDRYQKLLRGANGTLTGSGAEGAKLFEMLVAPAAIAPGTRVLVIPDGRLHALNFETLVNGEHYWIEDVTLSNVSSLQLADRVAQAPRGNSLLLVGDAPQVDRTFPKLTFAHDELGKVARHFDAASTTTLAGARATPSDYRAANPGKYDNIHFVAHGFATRKRPLDSAVILGRDSNQNYKLFARDIVKTALDARLVTISSCHGAGTREFVGEGLVGLAWAFLAAGADQVVAGLWEVNDSLTPALMDRMYAELAAGREPAEALREAKLAMVRGSGKQSRAFYWAPFIHYF